LFILLNSNLNNYLYKVGGMNGSDN
jgi:hypothetical protein